MRLHGALTDEEPGGGSSEIAASVAIGTPGVLLWVLGGLGVVLLGSRLVLAGLRVLSLSDEDWDASATPTTTTSRAEPVVA